MTNNKQEIKPHYVPIISLNRFEDVLKNLQKPKGENANEND